ncbi:MAG: twin-arginine translocation pathway signal protein, partial [Xenococcaceae cyanobacterium]
IFYDLPAEVSDVPNDHSTFLWQSQNLWLMTQATRWQQIKEFPKNADKIAQTAWRTDLYREIADEMGIKCPTEDFKVESAEAFIDNRAFDPSDPVAYLDSFKIRANAPRSFFMS